VQTRNKVGFMESLIYQAKQMECGVIGHVSSRVLELHKQPPEQEKATDSA
jgi:hypothetical protein